jgi:hypothetical protein
MRSPALAFALLALLAGPVRADAGDPQGDSSASAAQEEAGPGPLFEELHGQVGRLVERLRGYRNMAPAEQRFAARRFAAELLRIAALHGWEESKGQVWIRVRRQQKRPAQADARLIWDQLIRAADGMATARRVPSFGDLDRALVVLIEALHPEESEARSTDGRKVLDRVDEILTSAPGVAHTREWQRHQQLVAKRRGDNSDKDQK